jgi:hypothetical protein
MWVDGMREAEIVRIDYDVRHFLQRDLKRVLK